MKFFSIAALALVAAGPLAAQQAAAPAQPATQQQGDAQKIVAVINGETITKAKLDALYERLGAQLRAQYEQGGGKKAFLDNYIGKRLLLQEAIKTGFDKKPNVQLELDAAKESALFDLYVRNVVAAQYLTDADVRKYYDEHPDTFMLPERVHVRHIVITPADAGPRRKTKGEALELITKVFADLQPFRPKAGATDTEIKAFSNRFAEAARKYSEDGVAEQGGDLGWVHKGVDLDKSFADALYGIPRGMMSGVVETKFGYHLIFVEDKLPAAKETFENVQGMLREFLMTRMMSERAADVLQSVNMLTNELRSTSKVAVYPENLR
jgi:parvulin-like peptidyl-prolyl isomerase